MGALSHPFRAQNDFCFLRPCPSDMGIDFATLWQEKKQNQVGIGRHYVLILRLYQNAHFLLFSVCLPQIP